MEIFSYEDALLSSLEYFKGDELAAKVFLDANALKNDKGQLLEDSPIKMHRRMAREFARIEKKKFKAPLTEEEIFELFDRFRYIIPQSSPMTGIGNHHQVISLSNCFVIKSPSDSYGGIMKADEHLVQLSKRRGGVGVNLSNLRPDGSPTRNASKTSSGVIGFAERYSNSIREVGQNGRRGALMEILNIHHPQSVVIPDDNDSVWDKPSSITLKGDKSKNERDIHTNSSMFNPAVLDFASMKLDRKKITGANVSIALTDEFLTAVKDNKTFEQRFPIDSKKPIISKWTNARRAWKKIIHMAWQSAEPGLLFWDKITKYNACDCYSSKGYGTVCTNPCGEIPLPAYDSCRLFAMNLLSFVSKPYTKEASFDFKKLDEIVGIAQRLMDDLVDLEQEKIVAILDKVKIDPESNEDKRNERELWEKILKTCTDVRRTGLGFTALGDTFAALGLKYDSDEALVAADSIMRAFKLASFSASVDMAEEIGPFPIWDWELEKDSPFLLQIKEESPKLYNRMAKHGRRNIANLTIAPTGTPSIFAQTSSGCEPVFALSHMRRKKVNPGDKGFTVDFVDNKGDSWQHFEVNHVPLQEWMRVTGETDIKKSPWYGCCANDINWERRVKLQAVLQKHIDHSISSTVNIPHTATEADVAKIYETAWLEGCKGITVYREGCRSGVLVNHDQKSVNGLVHTSAPKRPVELKGEIFALMYKKEKLYVAVGLWEDGSPYEIFTGINFRSKIEHAVGKIVKLSRGKYNFEDDNKDVYELTNGHSNSEADALTRCLSAALRHGTDIQYLVHQLEKTKGDLTSFSKVISRVLKKYIKDGTKISGEECLECKSQLIRKEGCAICPQCGYSKCS